MRLYSSAREERVSLDNDGEIIFSGLDELIKMTPEDDEEWKRAYTASEGT
jgi:hypothetical protein